jgi:hypothetical protein
VRRDEPVEGRRQSQSPGAAHPTADLDDSSSLERSIPHGRSSVKTRTNPYDVGDDRAVRIIASLAGQLSRRARERRYRRYRRTILPGPDDRIVDVGCGNSWSLASLDPDALVTGVDLAERDGFDRANQQFVQADACDLPFEDRSFEIAYSNSLIEHIAVDRRPQFASEITRVAKRYWVQTPNFWFPIEPHALLPGAQFLPPRFRGVFWRASPRRIDYEEPLELLSERELSDLFPDALVLRERLGPMTKSLIAVGPRRHFTRRGDE